MGKTHGLDDPSVFLEDHPPARSQYRKLRRAEPSGAIVVHTAENTTDTSLPNGGAEGVARFISTRTDAPGSYHTVVDSDSIVRVGLYGWEMFGEGTGGNRWALHLGFACRAAQWPWLLDTWVENAAQNGAKAAAHMASWMNTEYGVTIPAMRITAHEYRAGRPGFISHAELDPGRRTDPGTHFPWGSFLRRFVDETRRGAGDNSDMSVNNEVEWWQQQLNELALLGGPPLVVDGIRGPKTEARLAAIGQHARFGSQIRIAHSNYDW